MKSTNFGELLAEELGSAEQVIDSIIKYSSVSCPERPQLVINDETLVMLEYAKSSLELAFEALIQLGV